VCLCNAARVGATGIAHSFLTLNDTDIMYDLKHLLLSSGNSVPHELSTHEAAKRKPGTGPVRNLQRRGKIIYTA